ncbi:MAG: hypothetical protein OEY66_05645 [Gammaproteobacteria bacterium]|nr:hypothetical protein [Gammaproteobacteria bacterium]
MKFKYVAPAILMGLSALITGCSGGGGDSAVAAPKTLSGTAAAGAPIIGQVTVKGALGNTKSALIEANGNYNVDVSGLTAPYRLRAEGTVGGRTYRLHSYAEAADVGGNVNITPFTDLIVANAASMIAEQYFNSNTPVDLDPVEVEAQEAALQAKLQNVFTTLGVDAAINLLNSTFSADHTGLDAALDIVNVEVDPLLNVATITNLIENTSITDSIVDTADNTTTLTVTDPAALTTAVSDTQAIANIFTGMTTAFASGLPTQVAIQDYFASTFSMSDMNKALFLTDVTTDPSMIGFTLSNVVVKNLDSSLGTAEVVFNAGFNGYVEPDPIKWYVVKDATLGWQFNGDQRIVEAYFNFHCNDYDGAGGWTGSCGINTQFWDNDTTNNGTGGTFIASGTVRIIDGTDGVTEKAIVYLGTPAGSAPGDVQVYNESMTNYSGDWKGFGTAIGEIDPSIFAVGDIIEYNAYTQALDISIPTAPAIAPGVVPVATYTDALLFVPSSVGKYPTATLAAQTAINNFTMGSNLTVAWNLVAGTRNDEVKVMLSDSMGNSIETWIKNTGSTTNSMTFASTELDATAASGAGLDPNATTYELRVRIYTTDQITGQQHSRDYTANIPGPAATGGGGGGGSSLVCGYESGWNDLADAGLGAPINPNSFAEYETVLTDCGTAQAFTVADVAGSVLVDSGETTTFNDSANAGTLADPKTGVFDDGAGFVIDFEWYVEDATCSGCTHSYVVVYTDSTMDVDLPAGFSLRETSALMSVTGTPGIAGAVYSFNKYSEQSNYGDMMRSTGTDGEIWSSPGNVLQ